MTRPALRPDPDNRHLPGQVQEPDPRLRHLLRRSAWLTPLIVVLSWAGCYLLAHLTGAPSGDSYFSWLPVVFGVLMFVPLALVIVTGLVSAGTTQLRTPGRVLTSAHLALVVFAVGLAFGLLPGWVSTEGFPASLLTVLAMALSAGASLAPVGVALRHGSRAGQLRATALLIGVVVALVGLAVVGAQMY
jgi:hypothetical protein